METRTITEKPTTDPTYDPNNILDVGIEIPNLTLGAKSRLVNNIEKSVRDKTLLPEVREIMDNAFLDTLALADGFKAEIANQITEYRDDPVKITRILNAVKTAENLTLGNDEIELLLVNIDRINAMEQKNLINKDEAKRYENVVLRQITAIADGKLNVADFQEPQPTRPVARLPNAPFTPLTTDELVSILNGNEELFQDYLENRAGNALAVEGIERAIRDYKTRDSDEKMVKYLKSIIGNIYEKEMNDVLEENRPLLTATETKNFITGKKAILTRFKRAGRIETFEDRLNELNDRFVFWTDEVDDKAFNANLSNVLGNGLYGSGMIQKHLKSRRVRIGGGIERQERAIYQK